MSQIDKASACIISTTDNRSRSRKILIAMKEGVASKRASVADLAKDVSKSTTTTLNYNEHNSLDEQAREWFRNLSSEERSGATRFSDGAFLGAFLSLATPWSKTSNTSKRNEDKHVSGGSDQVIEEDCTPWDVMISLNEFSKKYEEISSSLNSDTPKLANRKSSVDEKSTDLDRRSTNVDDSNDDNTTDDDFRIRQLRDYEVSFLRSMNNDQQLFREAESNSAASLRHLVDEVAIIFPSVFQSITGNIVSNPQLLVRPSYFDYSNQKEQQPFIFSTDYSSTVFGKRLRLKAFDKSMKNDNKDSLCWSRRIIDDSDGDSLVPLSYFLVARLEWAAWESFLEFEYKIRKKSIFLISHSDSSIESWTDKSFEDNHYPRNHLLSVLGDILSHSRVVNDRSLAIDSSTLESFVAPLANVCFSGSNIGDDMNLDEVQNVILTPISWVWFASQRNSPDVVSVVDKAIAKSLEKMDSNREMSDKSTSIDYHDHGAGVDTSVASGAHEPSPRKKKKKNKKRKSKKSVPGENQNSKSTLEKGRDSGGNISTRAGTNSVISDGISGECENCGNVDNSSDDAVDGVNVSEVIDNVSVDSDDTSLDMLVLKSATKLTIDRNDEISLSRQDRRMVVSSPVSSEIVHVKDHNNEESVEREPSQEPGPNGNTEWDSWATVEVRSRSTRKKPLTTSSTPPPPPPPQTQISTNSNSKQVLSASMSSQVNEQQRNINKKSKGTKNISTSTTQKKKSISQRIVSDILSSVIDSIDDEAKKIKNSRHALSTPTRAVNSWKNGPPGIAQKLFPASSPDVDIDVNFNIKVNARQSITNDVRPNLSGGSKIVDLSRTPFTSPSKGNEFTEKSTTKTDQNTAPTYQDTSSSSSNVILGSKELQNATDRKSDTSSSDTDEVPDNNAREINSKLEAIDSTTPPLPTLLSPANANSATSSVASSLEATPRGRIHHHSDTVKDVNDVGYHLLDVCDRLSRDMSLFMSRRALALNARRRERGAILSALQKSVASIWPGRCHVELYGSCATQLDLPSSDIDVVVLGLYKNSYVSSPNPSDNKASNTGVEESYINDELRHPTVQSLVPQPVSYGMLQHQRNAEQVVKLAADLEKQPWAVQVNAIPTASVPVIKVLADPSKLGNLWNIQQQQLTGRPSNEGADSFDNRPNPEYSKADSGSYPPPTHVPWRGSDVMKGLLSLDITFEGPEHGGIGSTEFSSRTVAEACQETGLHPDATPFVQTLMVLKELLAQRKLNEPYSGGLSSYALLLLVLALVRERAVIREEIELVEQQRRAMSGCELDSFPNPSCESPGAPDYPRLNNTSHSETLTSAPSTLTSNVINDSFNDDNPIDTPSSQPTVRPSSWAMIAKMNPASKPPVVQSNRKNSLPTDGAKQPTEIVVEANKPSVDISSTSKPTFADAVAGSNKSIATKMTRNQPSNEREKGKTCEKATKNTEPLLEKVKHSERTPSVCHSAPQFASNTQSIISPIGGKSKTPIFYPQGYNDIVEVLCSGETTAGKLLMHFLLYYGQHFDAQSTAIDISGKHERNYDALLPPNSYLSPYIQRQPMGNIDPRTGMLTVDCLIVYDPLEGSENNNVSRRCFAWNSVRWIFAQSYATLASFVERSATPPTTPNGGSVPHAIATNMHQDPDAIMFSPDSNGDLMDPSSPLLRCLLSF